MSVATTVQVQQEPAEPVPEERQHADRAADDGLGPGQRLLGREWYGRGRASMLSAPLLLQVSQVCCQCLLARWLGCTISPPRTSMLTVCCPHPRALLSSELLQGDRTTATEVVLAFVKKSHILGAVQVCSVNVWRRWVKAVSFTSPPTDPENGRDCLFASIALRARSAVRAQTLMNGSRLRLAAHALAFFPLPASGIRGANTDVMNSPSLRPNAHAHAFSHYPPTP